MRAVFFGEIRQKLALLLEGWYTEGGNQQEGTGMNLTRIQYFVEVARRENFSQAAKALLCILSPTCPSRLP